jgi:hypothetical protein
VPHLYADFNDFGPTIGLGYFGTHRDLCQQRLPLCAGMTVVLRDDADGDSEMQVNAVVERVAGQHAHPTHFWVARVVPNSFRRVPARGAGDTRFLCFGCGTDLTAAIHGLYSPGSRCPTCQEFIFAPYLRNSSAA